MMKSPFYDLIIVGAGPAGCSAAIFAERMGLKVALIEKASKVGPEPRGETLHFDPILDEIFGQGYMDKIKLSETAEREFYGPDTNVVIKKARKTPSIVFDWREFMKGFLENLNKPNIELKLNSEVIKVIYNKSKSIVSGVITKDKEGNRSEIRGKAVFACDGYKSTIRSLVYPNSKVISFPIIKAIMKNGNFKTRAFKYFLVPFEHLDFAPKFPPFIAFLFPRDGRNFETGILINLDLVKDLGISSLKEQQIFEGWVKFKDQYPVFSEIVRGSSIVYEKLTGIPMTGPVEHYIPKKGVVLIGDAAGFVEVSGGSGLISSIKMAKIWVNLLGPLLKSNSNENEESILERIWSDKNVIKLEKKFKKTKIHKHIVRTAKIYNKIRYKVFVEWKTAEKIMKKWKLIRIGF